MYRVEFYALVATSSAALWWLLAAVVLTYIDDEEESIYNWFKRGPALGKMIFFIVWPYFAWKFWRSRD